jgi:serine/threonine protein phosphatase PrpC
MPYIIVTSIIVAALAIARISLGPARRLDRFDVATADTLGKRLIQADAVEWGVQRGDRLFVLADGIGRESKGRLGALIAADAVARYFTQSRGAGASLSGFFRQAFYLANTSICKYIPDNTAGASVLALLIRGDEAYYALAGECRLSLLRGRELITLTEGQTFAVLARDAFYAKKIDREYARRAYLDTRVYNYIGRDRFREPEMCEAPVRLRRGDILALMTDGVYETCQERDLEEILLSGGSCEETAQTIIRRVNETGDPEQDNATVILIRYNG